MRLVACLAVWLAVAQSALGMSWSKCEDAQKLWKPVSVSITPDPAVAGENVAFRISGVADHDVEGGSLVASVTYAGMPIAEQVKDLCASAQCPIKQGPVDVTYQQVLPPFVPPGSYEVMVQVKNYDDELLMCIVVDFDINGPSMQKIVGNLMGSLPSFT